MKRRVFVGISCSSSLSHLISNWIKNNQSLLPKETRIIRAKNWHLTLVPPWYEKNINHLLLNLENEIKALNIKPFEIAFERISLGPTKSRPRMVWLEGKSNFQLKFLKDTIQHDLKVPSEKRFFIPHITIIRFKKNTEFSLFETKVEFKEKVKSVCLFESKLSSKGSSYQMLKRFKFGS